MAKVKLIVAKTPEQLARILGLTPQHAATWTVQGALQKRITQIVKKDKFTHAALAKLAGTSWTRITAILNNNLDEVRLTCLLELLGPRVIELISRFRRKRSRLNIIAWKEVNLAKWADDMGVDINEIDQKLKLREMIIKIRNKKGMRQKELMEVAVVSSSKIAQIEAGIKLHRASFDVFLRILQCLGYRYKITVTKLAA